VNCQLPESDAVFCEPPGAPELLLLHAESIIVPARHDSTNLEWIQHELQSLPEPQAVAGAASLPERQQKQK
jgi:hypothetical protein